MVNISKTRIFFEEMNSKKILNHGLPIIEPTQIQFIQFSSDFCNSMNCIFTLVSKLQPNCNGCFIKIRTINKM